MLGGEKIYKKYQSKCPAPALALLCTYPIICCRQKVEESMRTVLGVLGSAGIQGMLMPRRRGKRNL